MLYLKVSEVALSSVLVVKRECAQWPVYYVSKVMIAAKRRYLSMEKLTLALVVATRKLRSYFYAHTIMVKTNHPIKQVMQSLKYQEEMSVALWS